MLEKQNEKGLKVHMRLSELGKGCKCTISENTFGTQMRRRISDMGFIKGSNVECVGESIFGDPRAYLVKGSVFALRNSDAENIICI